MCNLIPIRKLDMGNYLEKKIVQLKARDLEIYLTNVCLPSLIQTPSDSFHFHPPGSTTGGQPIIYQIHS